MRGDLDCINIASTIYSKLKWHNIGIQHLLRILQSTKEYGRGGEETMNHNSLFALKKCYSTLFGITEELFVTYFLLWLQYIFSIHEFLLPSNNCAFFLGKCHLNNGSSNAAAVYICVYTWSSHRFPYTWYCHFCTLGVFFFLPLTFVWHSCCTSQHCKSCSGKNNHLICSNDSAMSITKWTLIKISPL